MNAVHAVMLLVIASIAYADQNPSLATVLTPDGRIIDGASGSFDPEGFCMNYGPEGEPLFEEDPVSPWEPVFWPDGQDPEGAWYTLGSGVNYYVYTIDISDTGILYAGGTFTSAGGVPAKFIALWDGSSWYPLGIGVNLYVHEIVVSGSDVYVGGFFGLPVKHIARWDGSSWHSVGGGVDGYVRAVAVNGADVYVGGDFSQAGGIPVNRIARWAAAPGILWAAVLTGASTKSR